MPGLFGEEGEWRADRVESSKESRTFSTLVLSKEGERKLRVRDKKTKKSETLTPFEWQILWLLIKAKGELVSHDDILKWFNEDPEEDIPISNTFTARVSLLRAKVEKVSNGRISIQNIYGMGWFIKEV